MGGFQTIIYEKRENVAHITLNRPEVLNAYNIQMRDDLHEVLTAVADDCEVRALIITGAGNKAFCAGADLTEFGTAPSMVMARKVRWERDVWGVLLSLRKPTIAALHGYVLGSGLEIAMCCDLRIAAESAQLGLPEVSLGFIPAAGGTQTLPRIVGSSEALEMLLAAERIDAHCAYQMGLVHEVVPRKDLMNRCEETTRKLLLVDSTALSYAKEAIGQAADLTLHEGIALEKRITDSLLSDYYRRACLAQSCSR